MQTITIQVRGMSCDSCVADVIRAIRRVPGVLADTVTIGSVTVSYEPSVTDPATIFSAIERVGYQPTTG
jgi:copper chaperone CopZ